jgi:hypothetical protein
LKGRIVQGKIRHVVGARRWLTQAVVLVPIECSRRRWRYGF